MGQPARGDRQLAGGSGGFWGRARASSQMPPASPFGSPAPGAGCLVSFVTAREEGIPPPHPPLKIPAIVRADRAGMTSSPSRLGYKMNEADRKQPKFTSSALRRRQEGPRGSALNFDSRRSRPLPGAALGSPLPPRPPPARPRRMQISPLLAGGLLLALLSVRLEAKPASQLPQKVRLEFSPALPPLPVPLRALTAQEETWGDCGVPDSVQRGVLLSAWAV